MHRDDEPIFDKNGTQIGSGYRIDSFGVPTGDEVYDKSGYRVGWAFYGSVHITNPNEHSVSDSNDFPSGCSAIFDGINDIFRIGWYLAIFLLFFGGVIKMCASGALDALHLQGASSAPTWGSAMLQPTRGVVITPSTDQEYQSAGTPNKEIGAPIVPSAYYDQLIGVVKVSGSLNLRALPTTNSNSRAKLPNGTLLEIRGRNSEGSWLSVNVPTLSKEGRVSTDFVETKIPKTEIPIVRSTAPLATTSPPKDTATPISPNTATPPVPDGIELNFLADQETIQRGQCTMIRWGIGNVQAIYLDGQALEGGYAEKQVCPNSTTTYTMRIVLRNGNEIERKIVVRVE